MPFLLDSSEELTPEMICSYIKLHTENTSARYKQLQDYYEGKQKILMRTPKRADDPCNNVVANFAKYITDIASGYQMGEPVSYQSDSQELAELLDWYNTAQVDVQDIDNSEDQSIYGVAYELVYMSSDDSPQPKVASIHPSQGFVIYDNTVEFKPVGGIYYTEIFDKTTQQLIGYSVDASTPQKYIKFKATRDFNVDGEVKTDINPFKAVTLIEIYNNKHLQGDFEQLISLIDGYNKQQSNRVDDKENFVNSLMVLKGQTLGYSNEEKADTYRSIKENGVIEISPDGDLSFLTRQSDQQGDELLRQSLADDIHKFSYVPSFTDKDFGGNISGIAMQFKLFGLNQLMKKKDRYTKEGLRYRMQLFSNIFETKGKKPIDVSKVTITINHSSPKNLLEIAQTLGSLEGLCSKETLVAQLPFVENPEKEVEKANAERQQSMDTEFVMSTPAYAIKNNNDEE